MRLIYLIEGEPYAGSLQNWADAVKEGYYASLEVQGVWLWQGGAFRKHTPSVVDQTTSDDDWQTTSYSIYYNGAADTATVRIDLRA